MERLVIRMPFSHLSTYSLVWVMAAVVLCTAQDHIYFLSQYSP
uniref:CD200 molecule n=1 Tax=Homo sapiens TaxID=9606 RepID=A0AAQ5BHP5_HUMAN